MRKAVDFARQTADGLAAAHARNITHRDIKPDNLFVTDEGRVKILDFGLAQTVVDAVNAEVTSARTQAPITDAGTVLGTVGYMAPEQIRGLPVDHRADLFALGATLYEMCTGKRAFKGATPADTMSAVLTSDPPELTRVGPRDAAGARPHRAALSREAADRALPVGPRPVVRARRALQRVGHWVRIDGRRVHRDRPASRLGAAGRSRGIDGTGRWCRPWPADVSGSGAAGERAELARGVPVRADGQCVGDGPVAGWAPSRLFERRGARCVATVHS